MKDDQKFIVTRHTTLERLSHYVNILSLFALLASGFVVYLGLPYMSYNQAFAIHVISAAIFVSINWVVIPYNAFVNRSLLSYMIWPKDLKMLLQVFKNFLSGSEYPRYTQYDLKKKRFRNRLHPLAKVLLHTHYLALLISTLTGLVLYSTSLNLPGLNISGLIIRLLDVFTPSFALSAMGLARLLHLAAAYWFVAEVVIHVGMIQLDPKKFQHIKSMFIDGKEDLNDDETAEILNDPYD